MSAVKSASSPIADSLYPYMMKNRDYKLIRRIFLVIIPLICACVAIALIFSEQICVILFGEEYRQAAVLLRCVVPAMAVLLPTYIMSFPVLVPIGLSKYANLSNVLGAVLQIALLIALYVSGNLAPWSICLFSSLSEVSVFIFRAAVAWLHRDRMGF